MEIIKTNFKWNGTLKTRAKTDSIIIHHADAVSASVENIHSWHLNNGWAGIGYNFYIRKDGKIYEGRGWDMIGAHAGSTSGYNSKSIGICFEGKYNDIDKTMPQAQFDAGVWLIREALKKYGNIKILKHKDVTATSCPGQFFPFDAIIKGVTAPIGDPFEGYKKIIQKHCQFSCPPDIWKIIELHPYPESLYKKWSESYGG